MSQLTLSGTNFEISGPSVTVFGLKGYPSGSQWIIGINLSGDDYIYIEADPIPALSSILEVIDQDKAAGLVGNIVNVLVSSRVAVRLFLEGYLKKSDFETAVEGEMDTTPFMGENGSTLPYVQLPAIKFGEYTLPLLIFSELKIGAGTIATLDKDNVIV